MKRIGKHSRGFTLIEVLIALVVFMIAMLGLVALQRASISGASMGREHTAAVNVARFVMAWLENEAAAWPLEDTASSPPTDSTKLLTGPAIAAPGTWFPISQDVRFDPYLETSASITAGASYGTTDTVDTAPYCVGYRVQPIGEAASPVAFRVWVRVIWPRWGQYQAGSWTDCDAARLASVESGTNTLQVVELAGIVTREFTSKWSSGS